MTHPARSGGMCLATQPLLPQQLKPIQPRIANPSMAVVKDSLTTHKPSGHRGKSRRWHRHLPLFAACCFFVR